MAEYIEREQAISAIKRDCSELTIYTKDEAIWCVESIPAADVAQVVRCKDCIFKGFPDEYDTYFCERTNEEIQFSDFCSHAVREEQNND